MRRLKRPVEWNVQAPFHSIEAFQDRDGLVYLALNETEESGLTVYRWQGGADWVKIAALPERLLVSANTSSVAWERLSFWDEPRDQWVLCTRSGPDHAYGLLTADHDFQVCTRTPFEPGLRVMRVSRFPDGDFLLDCQHTWDIDRQALRLSGTGKVRWRYRYPRISEDQRGSCWYGEALPDGTVALWVRDETATVHLELLDERGAHIGAQPHVRVGMWQPPVIRREGDDFLVDSWGFASRPGGLMDFTYTFRRQRFDSHWREVERRERQVDQRGRMMAFHGTCYRDGGLFGTSPLFPPGPCSLYWCPYDGSDILEYPLTGLDRDRLDIPDFQNPIYRRTDGSLVAAVNRQNANAHFSVVGFGPDRQPDWAIKLRCEGRRFLFFHCDELLVILRDVQQVRALVYQLPAGQAPLMERA